MRGVREKLPIFFLKKKKKSPSDEQAIEARTEALEAEDLEILGRKATGSQVEGRRICL